MICLLKYIGKRRELEGCLQEDCYAVWSPCGEG